MNTNDQFYAERLERFTSSMLDGGIDIVLVCGHSKLLQYFNQAPSHDFSLYDVATRRWDHDSDMAHMRQELTTAVVGVEAASLPLLQLTATGQPRDDPAGVRYIDAQVSQLRRRKDNLEIATIARATRAIAHAVRSVGDHLADLSEIEIECSIYRNIRQTGMDGWAFDPSVASGARGSVPWCHPSNRIPSPGEPITIDVGASLGGYVSDFCRTIIAGGVSTSTFEKARRAVRSAKRAGIQLCFPGTPLRDIAMAMAAEIENHGFAVPSHALGHGIGLDLHEPPTVSVSSKEILFNRTILNIEPAVYIERWGGYRDETTVLVTQNGPQVLADD